MTAAKTRAEMQSAARERQAKRARLEHEIALQERAEQTAKLRALRLAKEASDRKRARIRKATEAPKDDDSTS